MKRIIIVTIVAVSVFACKKAANMKTETAQTKYYFKIQPVEMDNTKNTTTTYKTITVY